MGKQDGCLQPEGKEVQAWDSVGQLAIEMVKGYGKAESPGGTKVFMPLATAAASTAKAYQKKLHLDALDLVSISVLLGEAQSHCTVFLHLALLTLPTPLPPGRTLSHV